ncbi:septal ring lytic transglycosylase RlpA family protein [Pelagicoccus albus]|uniref:Probable endolytic peptidoglycan transglycosylase RlpA n=1 Tax=Pelagicoccus albus TaxID=415222 RepID=A0A7X1E8V5_9BACT|nr:septal ring lytic transglycosylase RlpA family protein [Pelagicoccus albus]MBC2606711.1 septal ring lytic transglycosylase RlpA family protein [Pelagicoccus albus]
MSIPKTKYIPPVVLIVGAIVLALVFSEDELRGKASYYSDALQGSPTASGEPYDPGEYTAAHRELDFGTEVEVTYPETGESVIVVINDRGPHTDDRIIDLSKAAAQEIGLIDDGVGTVELRPLD